MAMLAVNGTLMKGLVLNKNLLNVGAEFIREDKTDPHYRIWSVEDIHPAMYRVTEGGTSVALEVWDVPDAGLISVLLNEPPGLSIGNVHLADGSTLLGVLGEPYRCEGMVEITEFGGWRAYTESKEK
jgi:hypothetical protein